jgi:hypothetical protein
MIVPATNSMIRSLDNRRQGHSQCCYGFRLCENVIQAPRFFIKIVPWEGFKPHLTPEIGVLRCPGLVEPQTYGCILC